MFKKKRIHSIKSIRFGRWSRKGFAIFAGLKANISIGHLAKGVVDKLLSKTKTLGANPSVYALLHGKGECAEDLLPIEIPPAILIGLTPISVPVTSSEGTPVAFSVNRESNFLTYYSVNKITRGASDFQMYPFCV